MYIYIYVYICSHDSELCIYIYIDKCRAKTCITGSQVVFSVVIQLLGLQPSPQISSCEAWCIWSLIFTNKLWKTVIDDAYMMHLLLMIIGVFKVVASNRRKSTTAVFGFHFSGCILENGSCMGKSWTTAAGEIRPSGWCQGFPSTCRKNGKIDLWNPSGFYRKFGAVAGWQVSSRTGYSASTAPGSRKLQL